MKDWLVPREAVDAAVDRAHRRWTVREHVCDKSRWYDEFAEWAVRYGEPPLVEFPQTRPLMSTASVAFRSAVTQGAITHDGNPAIACHLGNAIATPHARGFFINKSSKHSARVIDLATATVMAHLRAIAPDLAGGRSVYETRAVIVV
ncbi:MAG: terminase TerL endonuclease subunit [Gaiellaceae bacterium]